MSWINSRIYLTYSSTLWIFVNTRNLGIRMLQQNNIRRSFSQSFHSDLHLTSRLTWNITDFSRKDYGITFGSPGYDRLFVVTNVLLCLYVSVYSCELVTVIFRGVKIVVFFSVSAMEHTTILYHYVELATIFLCFFLILDIWSVS